MKKIMFNDRYGLTQAVIDGRKTMTRRIVKGLPDVHELRINYGVCTLRYTADASRFVMSSVQPRYKLGEVVAVAQAYKDCDYDPMFIQQAFVKKPTVFPELDKYSPMCGYVDLPLKYHKGWANKMFVFPIFMPHRIRITDIKVERLQDCSDDDILKEGIFASNAFEIGYGEEEAYVFSGTKEAFSTPREAFAALIDKVNGKGTWESNPWVFVYTFELMKGGEE